MALPINIEELLSGRVVETERLEFKEGWNPLAVLHTMCAFANDVNNWGGGYIVIGFEENNSGPAYSPKGLSPSEIKKIQKELLSLSHKMKPEYFPIVDVANVKGKDIVIIWVHGGTHRPYKAAETLGKGAHYAYYIRRNDTTKRATTADERSLMKLAHDIPFDDCVNHKATLKDLDIRRIEQYLHDVKSDLVKEISVIPFKELCHRMNIVEGPNEFIRPKNIGLLLFCPEPQKFFPRTTIDVVRYKDEVGDAFEEKIFAGPVHEQVRLALKYIKDLVIVESVRKVEGRAEANRFFNYPYAAIEEALVNAVYHRSYEEREPIEVRIYPDKIFIISYPGPLPPLGKDNLNNPIVTSRLYRNSRLGDALKELKLTEGRCTGFPKIRRALKTNGSPPPYFETDDDRTYFMVTLKIHPKVKKMAAELGPKRAEKTVEMTVEKTVEKILGLLATNPRITQKEIMNNTGLTRRGVEWNLKKLKNERKIKRIGPDKGGYWEIVK